MKRKSETINKSSKDKVGKTNGNSGNTSLTAAPIAPMSAPMFIVLAIRRRLASGRLLY